MKNESFDDLQVRILDALDGVLDSEGMERLDAELHDSQEARRLYIQLATLHSALDNQTTSHSDIGKVPVIPIERLLARQRRLVLRNSLLATAAVLTLSAVALWLKHVPAPAALAQFQVTPETTFSLTHSEEGETPAGHVLGEGSRLQLTQGTMEGQFASGTRFVIEAPCDFSVITEDRISLKEGVAWFEVTPQATGFTVETRQLTAVDLGTKFGIIAVADKNHELHVTEGVVELSPSGSAEPFTKITLHAGDARRVDNSGKIHEISVLPSHFTKSLPDSIRISNHSFEADQNQSEDGVFNAGKTGDFGGKFTAWTVAKDDDNKSLRASVGWKGIQPSSLDPHPATKGRASQALSLMSGGSVHNVTATPWSRLAVGDQLILTISLGMRGRTSGLTWNEETFFGLTDGSFRKIWFPSLKDTVAHSGNISVNPATGTRSGDGTMADVSLQYTVKASDLRRPGNVGILLAAKGSSQEMTNQSFFDNVRLQRKQAIPPVTEGR